MTGHDTEPFQELFYEPTGEINGEIHERLYSATSLPPAKGRKVKHQENIDVRCVFL